MSGFPEKLDCHGREVFLRPGRPDMRRGKISVRLSNDKVVLSYGRGVTLADIERFLRSEKVLKWISKTTDRSNGVMRGGNAVYLLGKRYQYLVSAGVSECRFADGNLLLPPKGVHTDGESGAELPAEYAADVRRLSVKTLKRIVAERLPPLIELTGLKPSKIKITSANSYWGNMNVNTHLMRISDKVIEKPPECIDYLLLHELIHIRIPNHGAAFHREMARYMPDYRDRSRLLKK